jgi:hypothetical protein
MSSLKKTSIGVSFESNFQEKFFIMSLKQEIGKRPLKLADSVVIHSNREIFVLIKSYDIIVVDNYSFESIFDKKFKLKGYNILEQANYVFCLSGKPTEPSFFQLKRKTPACFLEKEIRQAAESCPLH